MIDSQAQRLNMVESQVRPSDVTDRRILRAMLEVPRELFVAESRRSIAYMDVDAPVAAANSPGGGRYLLAPRVLGKLLQEAAIEADMVVLDVGCATGYSTALIARLARRVVGLECDKGLVQDAQRLLRELGVSNAIVREGPLAAGVPDEAPFHAILLNGAVAQVPNTLLDQLKDGGRLLAVVAERGLGSAKVWTRSGSTCDARAVFDAGAKPLPGFELKAEFVF